MINSRKLADLHPLVRAKAEEHLARCKEMGVDILVTSTYRDEESQNALYAQGRTAPGPIVTKARGGQSFHQYKVAYDVVPLRQGKPVWGTKPGPDLELWNLVGALGEAAGLEWAGQWRRMREFPHFQFTGGHPLSYFQKGGKL